MTFLLRPSRQTVRASSSRNTAWQTFQCESGTCTHWRRLLALPSVGEHGAMMASTVADNVSIRHAPLSANPSRKSFCSQARGPMIASSYRYRCRSDGVVAFHRSGRVLPRGLTVWDVLPIQLVSLAPILYVITHPLRTGGDIQAREDILDLIAHVRPDPCSVPAVVKPFQTAMPEVGYHFRPTANRGLTKRKYWLRRYRGREAAAPPAM